MFCLHDWNAVLTLSRVVFQQVRGVKNTSDTQHDPHHVAPSMSNNSSLLTLKTNISPLNTVTVSKSPSQMSGAWLSGSLGGRGGAGGRGGGGGGGGRGTSFLIGGVTGWGCESVGEGVGGALGEVELGLGSGGSGMPSVGPGESGGGSLGGVGSGPSSGGEGELGESCLGSSSRTGGEVGGTSPSKGGPGKEKMERRLTNVNI